MAANKRLARGFGKGDTVKGSGKKPEVVVFAETNGLGKKSTFTVFLKLTSDYTNVDEIFMIIPNSRRFIYSKKEK